MNQLIQAYTYVNLNNTIKKNVRQTKNRRDMNLNLITA